MSSGGPPRPGANGCHAKAKAPAGGALGGAAGGGCSSLSAVLFFSVVAVGVNLVWYMRVLGASSSAEEMPAAEEFQPESWERSMGPSAPAPHVAEGSERLRGREGAPAPHVAEGSERLRGREGAPTPAPTPTPTLASGAAAPGQFRAKYGFYIHCFDGIPAIKYQVLKIKEFYPGSPIYIMSDGGEDFTELCRQEGCQFVLCPPANDRWHPWPFVRRFLDATIALNTEYVIMLEPDNTIHGPVTREPTADAGGIESIGRSFRHKGYIEGLARQIAGKESFQWTKRAMEAGLAGGSYFRSEAVLDSFTDERVAALDWNLLGEGDKKIFSSDFAMPYLLAARGWSMKPWPEIAQMEHDPDVPHTGAANASFKHYSRGFPGGKPTYRLKKAPGDELLSSPAPPEYKRVRKSMNCQLCWSLDQYVERWGTTRCTNRLPFVYSEKLQALARGKRKQDGGAPAAAFAAAPEPQPGGAEDAAADAEAAPDAPAAPEPQAGPAAAPAEGGALAAASDGADPGEDSGASRWRAKYGFYLHCFDGLPPILYQVRQIKQFFPGSPIYIMSDGGEDYSELCRQYGCQFELCPPANDRWNPWPFIRRFYDATVALNSEYVIMLEPDNTIHGPITRAPTADAGGIESLKRRFKNKHYIEALAREVVGPGFNWTWRSMEAGLAGGSYFRAEAVLDAFRDEMVARLDWNLLGKDTKYFSSDFAMPYLLAARGYNMEPWPDVAQMEKDKQIPHTGAADAAFKHYSRGFPGGKPTYRLRTQPGEELLSRAVPARYANKNAYNCQLCYNLSEYIERWGSARCTNRLPFEYSDELKAERARRKRR